MPLRRTPMDAAALAAANDARVVKQAVAGNQTAAQELVRRYERPVFNLLVRIVRDRQAAEDLAQDAFLKIFRTLDRFDVSLRFSAWALKIAHNTALDHLRRHRPELLPLDAPAGDDSASFADLLPDPSGPTPEQVAEQASLSRAIDVALDRLRPEYRTALVLRHQEDLEYEEIADVTGWPLGTVKTFVRRGRQALARELVAAGWAPPGGRD